MAWLRLTYFPPLCLYVSDIYRPSHHIELALSAKNLAVIATSRPRHRRQLPIGIYQQLRAVGLNDYHNALHYCR